VAAVALAALLCAGAAEGAAVRGGLSLQQRTEVKPAPGTQTAPTTTAATTTPLRDDTIREALTSWCDDSVSQSGAVGTYGKIERWDVSRVTNISRLFESTKDCNPNISAWNTSAVIDMSYAFFNASKFNQAIGTWNTGGVTNMSWYLYVCYRFQPAHQQVEYLGRDRPELRVLRS
jgi:hypothetical protein